MGRTLDGNPGTNDAVYEDQHRDGTMTSQNMQN